MTAQERRNRQIQKKLRRANEATIVKQVAPQSEKVVISAASKRSVTRTAPKIAGIVLTATIAFVSGVSTVVGILGLPSTLDPIVPAIVSLEPKIIDAREASSTVFTFQNRSRFFALHDVGVDSFLTATLPTNISLEKVGHFFASNLSLGPQATLSYPLKEAASTQAGMGNTIQTSLGVPNPMSDGTVQWVITHRGFWGKIKTNTFTYRLFTSHGSALWVQTEAL